MLNKKLKYLAQATLVTVFGLSTLALIGNTPAQAASLEITDFTSFNDPDSVNGGTLAYGINNHGAITGNTNTGLGFLYQGGNYTTLPNATTTTQYTSPTGINDRGEIVGIYSDANNGGGFLYQKGNYTTLIDPSAVTGTTNPVGINNKGEIVGFYALNDPNNPFGVDVHGFLDKGGNYTTLNYPNVTQTFTLPTGINNRGQIVGNYFNYSDYSSNAFLYQKGNYTTLNAPSGFYIYPYDVIAINDRGEIVGTYADANGNYDGFVYQGGTYTTVSYPGAIETYVNGINDRGEIVGYYEDANGNYDGFTAEVKAVPEPLTIAATFVSGVGLITARLKLRRKQKASQAA